jgi:hypothetical protein
MEPLSYPLLFSRGEPGWGKDDLNDPEIGDTKFYKYLCSRLLMPDPHKYDGEFLHIADRYDLARHPFETVRFNRFQAFDRLGKLLITIRFTDFLHVDFSTFQNVLISVHSGKC